MIPTTHRREITIGRRTISIETGKLAKQADGAVIVRSGDTMVLVTACHAANARVGIDFLPLTVDYREYTYASGRIPGGFFKREGKPAEKEVLTSRLIDRPLRPLFPSGWYYETQIVALLVSADSENDSDVLAITGASAALSISSIPFQKTVAGVRVGLVEGEYIINPTYPERKQSKIDLIVAGSQDAIMMVEAGAKEATEDEMLGALDAAHQAIKQIVAAIDDLKQAVGRPKKKAAGKQIGHEFYREVEEKAYARLAEAMRIKDKLENYGQVDVVLDELIASIPEQEIERRSDAKTIFKELKEKVMRDEILERGQRLDGRRFDEIRPIWIETGVLARVHGSAVFTRGETQALVSATLGTEDDAQKIESVDGESYKRFMLHYNFPPFSVGEVQFLRGPGRREVGHGALAERALVPLLPSETEFPYTVRIVSDILESNGSSSMASVCGGSLALMDAGVPLKAPVAGVAMGLVMDEKTGKWAVLSDIAGAEDHYGDMDFKVTGTRAGITALQMDIKVGGITHDIMKKALDQARKGRFEILDHMQNALAAPRESISSFAPRIVTIRIPTEKIRDVIGKGGATIRALTEETGTTIDIGEDGTITIASTDADKAAFARKRIEEITAEAEIGKVYEGPVTKILDFGALVNILPGKDGLLHISQIAHQRVEKVTDFLQEGQVVKVKVLETDDKGRTKLSMKALLERPEGMEEERERPPRREYGDRPRRDRGDRGDRPPREPAAEAPATVEADDTPRE